MKRDDKTVGDFGVRPAGLPDRCFYCGELIGGQHKDDCVILQRSVVVEVKVTMVRMVPASWTQEQIDFHLGNTCSDNLIRDAEQLRLRNDAVGCTCGMVEATYIREATAEDEDRSMLFVQDERL